MYVCMYVCVCVQGSEGYKNTRKGTSVAAQATAQAAAVKAHEFGYHRVRVRLKGPGAGRQVSGRDLLSGR